MHNLESGSTMANRAIITLLLLIAAVASVQAGNRQSSAGAGTGRSHLSERAGSENSSDQIGPIGVETHVNFFCIFRTDLSYTCRSDCDQNEDTQQSTQSFPDQPDMKYHDMNCSTDVPTGGVKWQQQDGIIRRDFDRAGKAVILATCAFYRTRWYECYGVADCGRGEGITHCAGAAPWRGYFEGTPQTGFRGNITAEAMNSPPMPDLTVSAPILAPLPENPQVPPAVKRRILYTCEKFFDSDAACNSVAQECWNGPSGRRSCKTTRLPYTRSSRNEHIFTKFDEIVKGISQQSIDASASGIVVSCYFYSSTDYVCGVPFAVDFNGSSRVRPADGSFFSGSS